MANTSASRHPVKTAAAGSAPAPAIHRRAWLGACAALLVTTACTPGERQPLHGLDITGATYGQDFRLADATGRERTLADFRGKLVLLFFGFTQCPDVCPTALAGAVDTLRLLGDDGNRIQVLFVSLDPERDTAEMLQAYATTFHPSFLGLRADLARTQETARHFKVLFRKVPQASSYTIEHSALVYAFDSSGRLRLALRPGQTPREQADDLRPLLAAQG